MFLWEPADSATIRQILVNNENTKKLVAEQARKTNVLKEEMSRLMSQASFLSASDDYSIVPPSDDNDNEHDNVESQEE